MSGLTGGLDGMLSGLGGFGTFTGVGEIPDSGAFCYDPDVPNAHFEHQLTIPAWKCTGSATIEFIMYREDVGSTQFICDGDNSDTEDQIRIYLSGGNNWAIGTSSGGSEDFISLFVDDVQVTSGESIPFGQEFNVRIEVSEVRGNGCTLQSFYRRYEATGNLTFIGGYIRDIRLTDNTDTGNNRRYPIVRRADETPTDTHVREILNDQHGTLSGFPDNNFWRDIPCPVP